MENSAAYLMIKQAYLPYESKINEKVHNINLKINDLQNELKTISKLYNEVQKQKTDSPLKVDLTHNQIAMDQIDELAKKNVLKERQYVFEKKDIDYLMHQLETEKELLPQRIHTELMPIQTSLNLLLEVMKTVSRALQDENEFIKRINQRTGK